MNKEPTDSTFDRLGQHVVFTYETKRGQTVRIAAQIVGVDLDMSPGYFIANIEEHSPSELGFSSKRFFKQDHKNIVGNNVFVIKGADNVSNRFTVINEDDIVSEGPNIYVLTKEEFENYLRCKYNGV